MTVDIINGTYSTDSTDTLYFGLLPNDLIILKTSTEIARTPITTFLAVDDASVYDLKGFNASGYPQTAALRVSILTQDNVAPRITGFDLNLYNLTVTIRFDEPVVVSTFDPTKVVLQNSIYNSTSSYTLTGGVPTLQSLQEIIIDLLPTDVNELKLSGNLCSNRTNCFITGNPMLVNDILGNVYDTSVNVVQVNPQGFVLDIIDPEFVRFDFLDLNNGLLQINFTEPVLSYTVNFGELTIQSLFTNLPGSGFVFRQLTGGNVVQVNGTMLIIQLNDPDLNFIKMTDELCASTITCWISFTRQFVQDTTTNPVVALSRDSFNNDQHAQVIIPDRGNPFIVDIIVDFDEDNVTLVFNEVIDPDSFSPTALTFSTGLNASINYTLQTTDVMYNTETISPVLSIIPIS